MNKVKYFILLFPLLFAAEGLLAERIDKQHNIVKTYKIDSRNRLQLQNSYGAVRIYNWDRKEIKVEIMIRVVDASGSRADETINSVKINESVSGRDISLRTQISSAGGGDSWWSKLMSLGSESHNLEINYTVHMPESIELTVSNNYGNVDLPDRDGRVVVKLQYGSLLAGNLKARDNKLSIGYSNVDIATFNGGAIAIEYGGLKVGSAADAQINLSYTDNATIDNLSGNTDVTLQYSGNFTAGIEPGIKKMNLAASYSSVNLNPAPGVNFEFNISVSYGNFTFDHNKAIVSAQSGENNSKNYVGRWGKGSGSSMNIRSAYSNISLR